MSKVNVTREMQLSFDAYRAKRKRSLAAKVLKIIDKEGASYILQSDLVAHNERLRKLLGQVRAYLSSNERALLYKLPKTKSIGEAVAEMLLREAGYPMTPFHLHGEGRAYALTATTPP